MWGFHIMKSIYYPKDEKGRFKKQHGLRRHILYRIWSNIKDRCYNPNNYAYKDYGGRGIKVCDEWKNDFKLFYDYMMALPNILKKGYSIDRINNDGNYEPGNLRIADSHIQATNARIHSDNKTGYPGVTFRKDVSKYRSRIRVYGNLIDLGTHMWPEDAYMARIKYIKEHGLTEYL